MSNRTETSVVNSSTPVGSNPTNPNPTSPNPKGPNPTSKVLEIDFLFLDESVCKPCGGTADALSKAISLAEMPLKNMGIVTKVNKIHVLDQKIAIAKKFVSSPTIRVSGKDIDPAQTEADCPSCGTLAGDNISVDCRTWHWQNEVYHSAPVGKIVEEIMSAAVLLSAGESGCCVKTCCSEDSVDDIEALPEFELPDNLKVFFDARKGDEQLGC